MNKALLIAMIAAVVAALILGLMAAGGPGYARMEKMDRERISDLNRIFNYLQCPKAKRPLPEALEDADYCPEYVRINSVSDPKTDAPYIYRRIDDTRFEVCAEFELPAESHLSQSLNRPLKFEGQTGCMSGSTLPD